MVGDCWIDEEEVGERGVNDVSLVAVAALDEWRAVVPW